MRLFKPLTVAALVSLLASPVLGEARNPAAKLSLDSSGTDRSASKVAKKNSALGGTGLVLLGLGVAGAVGLAVALGSGDSSPASN